MCQGNVFFSTMQVGFGVQAAETMEKDYKPLSLQHTAQCEEIRHQKWWTGEEIHAEAQEQWCSLCKDQLGMLFLYWVTALTVSLACIHKPH